MCCVVCAELRPSSQLQQTMLATHSACFTNASRASHYNTHPPTEDAKKALSAEYIANQKVSESGSSVSAACAGLLAAAAVPLSSPHPVVLTLLVAPSTNTKHTNYRRLMLRCSRH